MMKKHLVMIVLFFSSFGLAQAVTANITQLVFVTPARTVGVSVLSEVLTIQTQNSGGTAEKIETTGDLTFVSSSPTGEFLNDSGLPVSTVMNRNSSNRNFYYRDSVAGTVTLSVTVTLRDGGPSWTASQTITIGALGSAGGNSNNSVSAVAGSGVSAHSAPVELTSFDTQAEFNANPGRQRLAAIGSPLSFRAKLSSGKKTDEPLEVWWSFGDGTMSSGAEVIHSYQLPGVYQVVLNARRGDSRATSRTTVEVVEPNIRLSIATPEFIELENNDREEVNLGAWRLTAAGRSFTFPPDTIVAARGRLKLPATVSQLAPFSVSTATLYYPDGRLAARGEAAEMTAITNTKTPDADLTAVLQTVSAALASKKQTAGTVRLAPPAPVATEVATIPSVSVNEQDQLAPLRTDRTIIVGEPKSPNWWQRLFSK